MTEVISQKPYLDPNTPQSKPKFEGKFRWLTDHYFKPNHFESTTLYESLGIKPFKKYLPTSGDLARRYIWKDPVSIKPNMESLIHYEKMTRAYEAIHLGLAVLPGKDIVSSLLSQTSPHILDIVSLLAVSLYPIMLQRYNRIRVVQTIKRMEFRNRVPDSDVAL